MAKARSINTPYMKYIPSRHLMVPYLNQQSTPTEYIENAKFIKKDEQEKKDSE